MFYILLIIYKMSSDDEYEIDMSSEIDSDSESDIDQRDTVSDDYDVDMSDDEVSIVSSDKEEEDEEKEKLINPKLYDVTMNLGGVIRQQTLSDAERGAFDRISFDHNLLRNCFSKDKQSNSSLKQSFIHLNDKESIACTIFTYKNMYNIEDEDFYNLLYLIENEKIPNIKYKNPLGLLLGFLLNINPGSKPYKFKGKLEGNFDKIINEIIINENENINAGDLIRYSRLMKNIMS